MSEIPEIKIEKDIPYSQAEAKRQPKTREPHPLEGKLRAMSYGDSFFILGQESKDVSHISRLGDRIGVYLQSKTIKKDGELEGVRTWRRTLEQLSAKRAEKIQAKVAAGEFEPEDMSAIEEPEAHVEPPTQDENVGDMYWLHEPEQRYFRTKPGEDICWMRENCKQINEETYRDRTRYWVYTNDVKPVHTNTRSTADSLEESTVAEEVTASEYNDAMIAWCAQHDQALTLRYFEDGVTGEKVGVVPALAGLYADDPDAYFEISEAEFNGTAVADDLSDL